jgi:PAS domain S-box-containing protein
MMTAADFQKLFGRCDDAVFAADVEGKVVWWGESAERTLGHSAADAAGRPCGALLTGRDAAGCAVCSSDCHVLQQARKGQFTRNYDLEVRTARGRWRWFNVSTLLVQTNGSVSVVHMLRDIQNRKATELLAGRIVREVGKLSKVTGGSGAALPPGRNVSPRERRILVLLSESRSTEQMAEELGISPATVRNHVRNVMRKMQAHTRLEAVLHAIRNGII